MSCNSTECGCKQERICSCSGMHKVYCLDCGRFLIEAPASTWTWCNSCRRWSRVEPSIELHND